MATACWTARTPTATPRRVAPGAPARPGRRRRPPARTGSTTTATGRRTARILTAPARRAAPAARAAPTGRPRRSAMTTSTTTPTARRTARTPTAPARPNCGQSNNEKGLCGDGADNDSDGLPDCFDFDCLNESCGAGCVCGLFIKTETGCNDGTDNDGDGEVDCADTDCERAAAGPGCVCSTQLKTETACGDARGQRRRWHQGLRRLRLQRQGLRHRLRLRARARGRRPPAATARTTMATGLSTARTPTARPRLAAPAARATRRSKKETICSDNLDNDGDGHKDCA